MFLITSIFFGFRLAKKEAALLVPELERIKQTEGKNIDITF